MAQQFRAPQTIDGKTVIVGDGHYYDGESLTITDLSKAQDVIDITGYFPLKAPAERSLIRFNDGNAFRVRVRSSEIFNSKPPFTVSGAAITLDEYLENARAKTQFLELLAKGKPLDHLSPQAGISVGPFAPEANPAPAAPPLDDKTILIPVQTTAQDPYKTQFFPTGANLTPEESAAPPPAPDSIEYQVALVGPNNEFVYSNVLQGGNPAGSAIRFTTPTEEAFKEIDGFDVLRAAYQIAADNGGVISGIVFDSGHLFRFDTSLQPTLTALDKGQMAPVKDFYELPKLPDGSLNLKEVLRSIVRLKPQFALVSMAPLFNNVHYTLKITDGELSDYSKASPGEAALEYARTGQITTLDALSESRVRRINEELYKEPAAAAPPPPQVERQTPAHG